MPIAVREWKQPPDAKASTIDLHAEMCASRRCARYHEISAEICAEICAEAPSTRTSREIRSRGEIYTRSHQLELPVVSDDERLTRRGGECGAYPVLVLLERRLILQVWRARREAARLRVQIERAVYL